MGLCQSCAFLREVDSEKPKDNDQLKMIFPKKYLHENLITNPEESNDENQSGDKKKNTALKITKSRSLSMDEEKNNIQDKDKPNVAVENKQKESKKDDKQSSTNTVKRSESFNGKKEIKMEKLLSKKDNQNEKEINQIRESIQKSRNFKRRRGKSTTIMENTNVVRQLFLVQMSIPVPQELLVVETKGNPSDKYVKGKRIGSGTFGVVFEAKNIIFNNLVAMKVIPKQVDMDNLYIKNGQ